MNFNRSVFFKELCESIMKLPASKFYAGSVSKGISDEIEKIMRTKNGR